MKGLCTLSGQIIYVKSTSYIKRNKNIMKYQLYKYTLFQLYSCWIRHLRIVISEYLIFIYWIIYDWNKATICEILGVDHFLLISVTDKSKISSLYPLFYSRTLPSISNQFFYTSGYFWKEGEKDSREGWE